MSTHLAVFSSPKTVEQVLGGKKTIEIRFSQTRQEPYQSVARGDIILLKGSHGLITGQAEIDNVLFFSNLDAGKIARLRQEYGREAIQPDKYWQSKARSKYATVIFLRRPDRFITPLKNLKRDQRPWARITG